MKDASDPFTTLSHKKVDEFLVTIGHSAGATNPVNPDGKFRPLLDMNNMTFTGDDVISKQLVRHSNHLLSFCEHIFIC